VSPSQGSPFGRLCHSFVTAGSIARAAREGLRLPATGALREVPLGRTFVLAEQGARTVDIITCDSVQEARELVNLACAETVGGCQ
jgi:hypothetical protein